MRFTTGRRAAARYLSPLACCTLAACGSGDGFVGSGGVVGPLAPNFDSIQANIFEQVCEHCHSGATAPAGLRLDAANSYASLVGVSSVERPGVLRVAPGNANNSYLIHKLEGTSGIVGQRMPAGLPPVPQSDIDVVRQWIGDGALPAAAATGPIRVTSVSPEPSSAVDTLPASITIGFDRELNAPSVTAATFTLVRAGADGMLGTTDDVAIAPASIAVPLANPRSAVMDLRGVAPVLDRYAIALAGTSPAAILDLDGNALDGEGDGVAGGDFTATFSVAK
jgi:hypothetical protein